MTPLLENTPADLSAALQLRDIHLPAAPDVWPPAPGWWVLALLLLIALYFAATYLVRFMRRRRLQKQVLASLDVLRHSYNDKELPRFLTEVSRLLRQVAIMKFSRRQVAALSGDGWLSFLDQNGGGGQFTDGPGRVLATGPYAPASSIGEIDIDALLDLTRKWILLNLETGRSGATG